MKILKIFIILLLSAINLLALKTYSSENKIRIESLQKATKELTFKQFLDEWKKYHQDFYGENTTFVLKGNINIKNFATQEQARIIKQQNLQTLIAYVRNYFGNNIDIKVEKIGDNTIIIFSAKNKTKQMNKINQAINKLKQIDQMAKTLSNFNYKNFNRDIKKVIKKLEEYRNLEQ